MKILTSLIFECLKLIFRSKHEIALENQALRPQLAVQQRSIKRPKIKNIYRLFRGWLSRIWSNWKPSLTIVKPPTVIGSNKRGVQSYWWWKSRRIGRPTIDWELISLYASCKRRTCYGLPSASKANSNCLALTFVTIPW